GGGAVPRRTVPDDRRRPVPGPQHGPDRGDDPHRLPHGRRPRRGPGDRLARHHAHPGLPGRLRGPGGTGQAGHRLRPLHPRRLRPGAAHRPGRAVGVRPHRGPRPGRDRRRRGGAGLPRRHRRRRRPAAGLMAARSSKGGPPPAPALLEWAMGGLGALLVLAALTVIMTEAFGARDPARLEARVTETRPAGARWLAEVEVRNLGDETAASVEVEGRLAGETASATIDYVP